MQRALFSGPSFTAHEIGEEDLAGLQRFLEANPEYFIAVSGEGPAPDAARKEFEDAPPEGWCQGRTWLIRVVDSSGEMTAVAQVASDLLARGVWHIGLFIVATPLHGSGAAGAICTGLEAWMSRAGARWSRLGVVEGNGRARRFWERSGYVQVRVREGVEFGKQVRSVRVMARPLANGSMSEYLDLVERDRPGAP